MRQIHLAGFLNAGGVIHSHASWRHPQTDLGFLQPELYQNIGRILERGRFDLAFFADRLAVSDCYGGDIGFALQYGAQDAIRLDSIPILALMAGSTHYLGLGATRSTTYYQPFQIARVFATLDHLTRGRIAWNVVTSMNDSEAQNFGFEQHLEHDTRYDRADEFVEVAFKLWNSWQDEALILDRENGIFVDRSKVDYIHHAGQWFKSRGPLNIPRSPQGRPVIIQAGSSGRGKEFAARWAEVVFTIQRTPELMKAFYQDVKATVIKHGRNPEDCLILPAVMLFIAETEALAKEKQEFHNELVHPLSGLSTLSGHLNYDFAQHPLKELVSRSSGTTATDYKINNIAKISEEQGLTLEEIGKLYGASVLVPQIVGTPEQVADYLESVFREEACDGFVISPAYLPGSFEEFVEFIIPELQRRGLFRTDYTGKTLREHLGLKKPNK
jgi:FMN-dependent oxidoreductase (nitrilotriacetate monooxygenase family)